MSAIQLEAHRHSKFVRGIGCVGGEIHQHRREDREQLVVAEGHAPSTWE